MTDNRQSLSDLASLTQQAAQAPAAAPATNGAANGAEGETAAPVQTQPTTPLRQQELDKFGRAYATGRRKDAVARVWLKPGSGKITINGRDQEVYFARPTLRLVINQVFGITEREGQYDVVCTVKGGGLSGQVRSSVRSTAAPRRVAASSSRSVNPRAALDCFGNPKTRHGGQRRRHRCLRLTSRTCSVTARPEAKNEKAARHRTAFFVAVRITYAPTASRSAHTSPETTAGRHRASPRYGPEPAPGC